MTNTYQKIYSGNRMNLPCDPTGKILGSQKNKGRHLGFLLEEIIYLTAEYKYHSEFESIEHSHGNPSKMDKYDFEVWSHGSLQCLAEIKSLRIIDGVFDPNRDKVLHCVNRQRPALHRGFEHHDYAVYPFVMLVGMYEDSIDDVIYSLASYNQDTATFEGIDCYDSYKTSKLGEWYKFYLYVGYKEKGGWLDLSRQQDGIGSFLQLIDPCQANYDLTDMAHAFSAYSEFNNINGEVIMTLDEFTEFRKTGPSPQKKLSYLKNKRIEARRDIANLLQSSLDDRLMEESYEFLRSKITSLEDQASASAKTQDETIRALKTRLDLLKLEIESAKGERLKNRELIDHLYAQLGEDQDG